MDESFSYRCTDVPQDDKVAHLLSEKAYNLVEDLQTYLKDLRKSKPTAVNELMGQKTEEIAGQFLAYMKSVIEKEGRGDFIGSSAIFSKYVTDAKKVRNAEAKSLSDTRKNAVQKKKDSQEAWVEAELKKIQRLVDEEAARIRREAQEKVELFKKRLLIRVEKRNIREGQEVEKMESDSNEEIRKIEEEIEKLYESMINAVESAAAAPTV